MRYPATGKITQGFTQHHQAVDIAPDGAEAAFGSPIFAPEPGRISFVGYMGTGTSNAGLVVEVTADSGNKHRMCHNSDVFVEVGTRVVEGQHIAAMGNSGYVLPAPTIHNPKAGSHCHWVMFKNGARVDGSQYITKTPAPKPTQGDNDMVTLKGLDLIYQAKLRRMPEPGAYVHYVGKYTTDFVIDDVERSDERKRVLQAIATEQEIARQQEVAFKAMLGDIATLRQQVDDFAQRPTKETLKELQTDLSVCQDGAQQQARHISDLKFHVAALTKTQRTELEKTFPTFFDKLNSIFKLIRQRFQK